VHRPRHHSTHQIRAFACAPSPPPKNTYTVREDRHPLHGNCTIAASEISQKIELAESSKWPPHDSAQHAQSFFLSLFLLLSALATPKSRRSPSYHHQIAALDAIQ